MCVCVYPCVHVCLCICRKIYCKELDDTIMEAEKSTVCSWQARIADGVVVV